MPMIVPGALMPVAKLVVELGTVKIAYAPPEWVNAVARQAVLFGSKT